MKFFKQLLVSICLIFGLGIQAMQPTHELCLLRFKQGGGESVVDAVTLIKLIKEGDKQGSPFADPQMQQNLIKDIHTRALIASPEFIKALEQTGLTKLADAIKSNQPQAQSQVGGQCLLKFKDQGGQSVIDVITLIKLIREDKNFSPLLDNLVRDIYVRALQASPQFIETLERAGLQKLADAIKKAQQ